MFQPTKEWVNKVNLSSFELENFFKFDACVISARKAKQLDATTMFTYSHANTPLGQSERAYYLSYFINLNSPGHNQIGYMMTSPTFAKWRPRRETHTQHFQALYCTIVIRGDWL